MVSLIPRAPQLSTSEGGTGDHCERARQRDRGLRGCHCGRHHATRAPRYIDLIRRLVDAAHLESSSSVAGVPSGTIAEIIEAWIQATKLRPGSAQTRHRYVKDAVRFFTAQAGVPVTP